MEDFNDLSGLTISEVRERLGAMLLALLTEDRVVVFAMKEDGSIIAPTPTPGLVDDVELATSLLVDWEEEEVTELLKNRRRGHG